MKTPTVVTAAVMPDACPVGGKGMIPVGGGRRDHFDLPTDHFLYVGRSQNTGRIMVVSEVTAVACGSLDS